MKKDITKMKESGFNNLIVAALADVSVDENDNISVSSQLIDDIASFAEYKDMSLSIRLHGYVMNIRGNTDYYMINNNGELM